MTTEEMNPPVVAPPNKEKIKKIWYTALLLGIITTIEFIIAFTMEASTFRVSLFIGLTIVKAFYIVSEFMHLKYEAKVLIWSVLIPTTFIIWLLIAMLIEGEAIFKVRF